MMSEYKFETWAESSPGPDPNHLCKPVKSKQRSNLHFLSCNNNRGIRSNSQSCIDNRVYLNIVYVDPIQMQSFVLFSTALNTILVD